MPIVAFPVNGPNRLKNPTGIENSIFEAVAPGGVYGHNGQKTLLGTGTNDTGMTNEQVVVVVSAGATTDCFAGLGILVPLFWLPEWFFPNDSCEQS